MNENNSIDHELAAMCAGNAHSEYPLLRAGTSPISRYPAADFTPWIAQQLASGSLDKIASLMVELTKVNGGLGPGPEWWQQFALRLAKLDLHKFLIFHDERAYRDLHAAIFPYSLRGAMDGFIIVDEHVEYLVRAVLPFPFKVPDLEKKASMANAFIEKMRRELKDSTPAWTNTPLYSYAALDAVLCAEVPAHALRSRLAEATVGARQVFFGTLLGGAGQGAWSARPFGINEEAASAELVSLGLGVYVGDPLLVLMTLKKEELLAALDGFPTKQGWAKKFLIKFMMKEAPIVAKQLSEGKRVVDICPSLRDDGLRLAAWSNTLKDPLAIAIGFD